MSNPVPIELKWPQDQVNLLMAQMKRAARDLNQSVSQTVRFAAWSVATQLAKMTELPSKDVIASRKIRKVTEDKAAKKRKDGRKKFVVTRWGKDGKSEFNILADSLKEAKQHRRVRIPRWGLARAAWMWGVKSLGSGSKFNFGGKQAKDRAYSAMKIDKDLKRTSYDPFVRMTNSLPYALDAIPGGAGAVASVMEKAAKNMEKKIDHAVAKKMGAK